MADTEKITINLGPVDLGQVDLLVDQGFYSNRTDFIRIAIRNQLQNHSHELKQYVSEKYFVIGVVDFNRRRLEEALQAGKQIEVKIVGALVIDEDADLELVKKAFVKVKVYGMIKASNEVRKFLQGLNQSK
ncbi:CopG family transcriptional regulator [Paenibacillus eucommiae]|uniref:Arc/MetJ-type ribon-helix-helix transcriptional regulator n=1 Tax=Paenibacillus eucommiae TaxID=1355755 RepID=A0ABS4J883_9BACL|nr:CopG family transcriptional regulator [Paenibacillus eucommiae]MBP1996054.1 Arc/MetJ-type ribon-helix-helix transcriptional regulator [Paenibacillus eucommiae]